MKKSLLKRVLAVCLVLAMGLLTACGSSSSGGTAPAETKSEASSAKSEAAPAAASDEVYTIRFATTDAEAAGSSNGLKKWAEAIEKDSNGRLKVEFYWSASLCAAADIYPTLLSGGCEGALMATGSFTGTWPLCEAGQVPNPSAKNSVVYAVAQTETLLNNEQMLEETSSLKVLGLVANECFMVLSNSSDPSTLSNWKGARVRGSGQIQTDWLANLGAECVSIPVSETYEAYNKHIVDYVLWNWSGTPSFGLTDDTKYAMKQNLGYASILIALSADFYNSLPDDLKAIIDQYSGTWFAETFMTEWFNTGVDAIPVMIDAGIELVDASDEVIQAWSDSADKVKAAYIETLAGMNKDGEAYYEALQANIDKYNEVYDFTTFSKYEEKYGK